MISPMSSYRFTQVCPPPYIGELHFFRVIDTGHGNFALADEMVVQDVVSQAAISWKSAE